MSPEEQGVTADFGGFAVHCMQVKMCACTCRALVSSCLASSRLGPVMAVHSLYCWRTGCLFARCQSEFFKFWGTFNAVGEFVTQRNHRVLSVPLHLILHHSEAHTALCAHTHMPYPCTIHTVYITFGFNAGGHFGLPNTGVTNNVNNGSLRFDVSVQCLVLCKVAHFARLY